MSSEAAVSIQNLGKRFRVYADPLHRLLDHLPFSSKQHHVETWPFRKIDIEVERGSALGIIGENGAGKSTLLKIVSGITRATEGQVVVRGSLGSLLELGGGFHPAFTGRRNVFMNAAIMGIPQQVVRDRMDEIEEFSELGEAMDHPVRTYSSGMAMRLGFSIATMRRPDVLILDEVMAVGDQNFQAKCMERMREIRLAGTTILFVSHSMYHIRQICDRAVWLHDGGLSEEGDPIEVSDAYLQWMHAQRIVGVSKSEPVAVAEGLPRLAGALIHKSGSMDPVTDYRPGDSIEFDLGWENVEGEGGFHVAVLVSRNDDVPVFSAHSQSAGLLTSGQEGMFRLRVSNELAAGEYYVSARLIREEDGEAVDVRPEWGRFRVLYEGMETGIFLPQCRWMTPEEASTS
ncbi:MAG: polysaccharide ABC transporter ATP-binding protein [Planctomycetota bacterium]|nr:polysaccharide ABC transporter ATP-binding protein [Planctomycetota bacterium]